MSHVRQLIFAAAKLCAAGCVTPPAPMPADMDIDFVRGCWVQKDAPGVRAQAFLRLLPDGDSLAGQIADVSTGDWITVATFSFSRTGERATFDTALHECVVGRAAAGDAAKPSRYTCSTVAPGRTVSGRESAAHGSSPLPLRSPK